jgi:NAD(P)-binding Rossmann-like domain
MPARKPTIHERHGHTILERHHLHPLIPIPAYPQAAEVTTSPAKLASWPPLDFKVGIIGAGAAGLYTAMILQDLGIQYELLEANKTVGGRLRTHHFGEKPNDYWLLHSQSYVLAHRLFSH